MRLFSILMLILALVSQGAVARIHLMPEMTGSAEVGLAHHQHPKMQHHISMDGAESSEDHCGAADMTEHDCCESITQAPDCHSATSPCEGECGHCKVFSSSVVAILDDNLSLPLLTPQAVLTPLQSFLSVIVLTDNPPPIC